MSDEPQGHQPGSKISTGPNDRPRNAPIGQSASGLPDDSGRSVEPDPQGEREMARRLRSHETKEAS